MDLVSEPLWIYGQNGSGGGSSSTIAVVVSAMEARKVHHNLTLRKVTGVVCT
jgi:hypothetical protein